MRILLTGFFFGLIILTAPAQNVYNRELNNTCRQYYNTSCTPSNNIKKADQALTIAISATIVLVADQTKPFKKIIIEERNVPEGGQMQGTRRRYRDE